MMTFCKTRVLVTLLLTSLLAACGGGGGGDGAAPVPPPAVTVPVTPPVTAPVEPPAPTVPVQVPQAQYTIPTGLWSAPSGATPASGNYVYLQSSAGDYIGGGRTYSYTNADTVLSMSSRGLSIEASVRGNQSWTGTFLLPSAALTLQSGYFKELTRTAFSDAAVGGVDWSGEGRGCNKIQGWVVIDRVVMSGGMLDALDLRFQQACDGGAPLYGQIHWNKADVDSGKVTEPAPIPTGLWRAPASAVPPSGNYMHLESTQGDYIGAGRTYSYTQSNAAIKLTPSGNTLTVAIGGDESWSGDFQGLYSMSRLAVGYYGVLGRYPFSNPVLGGLSWSGDGRGCNSLSGWFVVDKISYSGNTLTALDLRFEQHCEGGAGALRGQLHWTADDTSAPMGPQNPPPANLWAPDASFVAPPGNYVYLVSTPGDYIGGGVTELLSAANTSMNVTTNLTAALRVGIGSWSGDFVGMSSMSQLQPGYYGDLQRYPFHNPNKGGLSWGGKGRGCNTLKGWFIVDKVSYSQAALTAIDLRFEQRCEGGTAALRGVIHWIK